MLSRPGPQGFLLLRDFILEVEAGTIANTRTAKAIAAAFERIIDGREDAEHALGLARKRGERKPITAGQQAKKNGAIWRFITAKLEGHATLETTGDVFRVRLQRGALTRAVSEAAKKFGTETRTVERIWQQHEISKC